MIRLDESVHTQLLQATSIAMFGHALRLSLGTKSDLTIMPVDPKRADQDFKKFPRVWAHSAGGAFFKREP